MILKEFFIKVDVLGNQFPLMNTGNGEIGYLSNLAIGYLSKSKNVLLEINNIEKVINKITDKHYLCNSELLSLDIFSETTFVSNNIGDIYFKSFNIPTVDLLTLLNDWYKFLDTYESNKIPGIIYNQSNNTI